MSEASKKIDNAYQTARIKFDENKPEEVIELCHQYLEHDRDDLPCILLLSKSLMQTGRFGQASNYLTKANRLKPNDPEILADLGRILYQTGDYLRSQRFLANSLLLDPTSKPIKISFTQSMGGTTLQIFEENIRDALGIILEDKTLRHRMLFSSWHSLIQLDPKMRPWNRLVLARAYESFSANEPLVGLEHILNNEFFGIGLKRCIIHDFAIERTLGYVRRYILEHSDDAQKQALRPFLCALATQCFYNEYMIYVTPEETQLLDKLKTAAKTPEDYILLACYGALYEHENALAISEVLKGTNDSNLAELARVQIDEPLAEQALKSDIPSFTDIDDAVSKAVKQQYEESPYPRWISISGTGVSEEKAKASEGVNILVAGCGTGQQSATMSINFPRSEIMAIDLSFSSLSYAKRKTAEMGFENITFKQGDLLKVEKLDQKFDLIACGGVLHHMDSPKDGLRALRDILKPGGAMRIALYSEIARKDIVLVQNWVEENNYEATPEGIRRFRHYMINTPDDPFLKTVMPLPGMLSTSETRDTFFNVQEHRFTCLQLKSLIEELDLELLLFGLDSPALHRHYCNSFPDDPNALNLNNWHIYEQNNPNTFLMMYSMVLAKKGDYAPGELPDWMNHQGASF